MAISLDGALLPENQEKLVITAAPYGPQWEPGDFPSDIAVTIEEQVQKAVDCYNAGATVLHFHAREDDVIRRQTRRDGARLAELHAFADLEVEPRDEILADPDAARRRGAFARAAFQPHRPIERIGAIDRL